ncbi:hypothetical protein [Phycicoccus sonneratiae]|uniref:Uncharacterized protein n=1 Tax=Phycicoccus sonneratiae TaxID=2807628 RepID=A0ABS2CI78_9MICO|nr:hypothetical protein [Phycicoccus sonneraticus]MBM6399577.1 hypothetical protein [Phycicoccus sonneraticus]
MTLSSGSTGWLRVLGGVFLVVTGLALRSEPGASRGPLGTPSAPPPPPAAA